MPPGRKPLRTRAEFVEAAIALADRAGIEAVTTRAVAASVGASATGIYRYFTGRDDLLLAMRETLLAEVFDGPTTDGPPREALLSAALGFRAQARNHPCLSQLMTMAVTQGDLTKSVTAFVTGALAELGLEGPLLARGYRQLETFVIGATLFDFAGAPTFLDDRLQRMRVVANPTLDDHLGSPADVDADNEAAFATTLTWIIDGLITEAETADAPALECVEADTAQLR